MKLKSTALAAALFAASSSWATPPETNEWFMLTDTGETLQVFHVSCLVAPDSGTKFSVLMDDNTLYEGVGKVTFKRGSQSGVTGVAADADISLLADPVANMLTVAGAEGKTAAIYDAGGRLVHSAVVDANDVKIDVSDLAGGIYVLKVGHSTVKFIKK